MLSEAEMFDLSLRVARLETGQHYIMSILAAVAVPIYWQFINSITRKLKGERRHN